MDISKLRVLGGTFLLTGALAAGSALGADQAYIGYGTIDSLSGILPDAWAVPAGTLENKGEVVLDDLGNLVSARIEIDDLRMTITSNAGGPVYGLVVEHASGDRRAFGLKNVSAVANGQLRLRGTIVGDGMMSRLDYTNPDPKPADDAGAAGPLEGGIGPDVTASRIGLGSSGCSDDFDYYGAADGKRAFSIATTSCNIGDETAEWISGSGARHPLIGQNLFRLNDGRFEQVGYSWLKHSFCAVSEPTCGSCQSTNCDSLGIGCADTYWAGLNDGQNGGAKADINPMGMKINGVGPGTHTHPYTSPSADPATIRGRLQVADADITDGGSFFAEIQYVTHDEPIANRHNNASYRPVNVTLTSMSGAEPCQDSVRFGQPGIQAWKEFASASIVPLDTPGEGGRVLLGYLVTDNGDGTWHYEYAIQNLNSDASVRNFVVPIDPCVEVTNVEFHDVDYHSGELGGGVNYDGTDWPDLRGAADLSWETESFATNPNANAIRWGTLYNFRFDANVGPTSGEVSMALFKEAGEMTTTAKIPSVPSCGCTGDINGDNQVSVDDLLDLLAAWGPCAGCAADLNGDDAVNVDDLLILLAAWGPCP